MASQPAFLKTLSRPRDVSQTRTALYCAAKRAAVFKDSFGNMEIAMCIGDISESPNQMKQM